MTDLDYEKCYFPIAAVHPLDGEISSGTCHNAAWATTRVHSAIPHNNACASVHHCASVANNY